MAPITASMASETTDGRFLPPVSVLALSEEQIVTQGDRFRAVSQSRLAYQAGTELRHLALRHVRIGLETGNRWRPPQGPRLPEIPGARCIAVFIPVVLIGIGAVGQGMGKKVSIFEAYIRSIFLQHFQVFLSIECFLSYNGKWSWRKRVVSEYPFCSSTLISVISGKV